MGIFDTQRVKPPTHFIWHHAVSPEMRGWDDALVADWFNQIGKTRTYAGYDTSGHTDVRTGEETFSAVPIILVPNGDGTDIYSDTWRVVEIFDWFNDIGWHCGDWEMNKRSVGCETAGRYDDKELPDNAVIALAEWIRTNMTPVCPEIIVKGHKEVTATACPGNIMQKIPQLIELINTPTPAVMLPKGKDNSVYRFWSPTHQNHFYTANYEEANTVYTSNSIDWVYENIAFIGFDKTQKGVHRFFNVNNYAHFYTSNDKEKESIIKNDKSWVYEGINFYCKTKSDATNRPVYRFWSDKSRSHFYTVNEAEKNHIISTYPENIWKYEGIAFYVQK